MTGAQLLIRGLDAPLASPVPALVDYVENDRLAEPWSAVPRSPAVVRF